MSTTAVTQGRQIRTSRLAAIIAGVPYVHLLAFGALVLKGAIDVSGMPSLDGPDPAGLGGLYDIMRFSFWPSIAAAPVLAAVAIFSPIRRDIWMRRTITAGIGLAIIVALMTVNPGGLWTWSGLPG